MPLLPILPLLGASAAPPVEALLYTTMASWAANRPEFAMDGDEKTAFRSYGGFGRGDSFTVFLSRPIKIRSIHVSTGEGDVDRLTSGMLETSADGTTFTTAASFSADGTATVKGSKAPIAALRIRTGRRGEVSHLIVREIAIDSPTPVVSARIGPGRGFTDLNGHPDLKAWSERAERQMESFWSDAAALLYSDGFITPNAVNVVYIDGTNLPPAATGGGVMSVDAGYARKHPDDTGLTVHEMAHVVQSGGSPGWLIEAVADYIRWIKFEPQNFTYRVDPVRDSGHSPYRPGAAFLGWCELHYDRKLVTKLNDDARFGRYRDSLFEKYCGKPIDVLWREFLAAYQKDPKGVLVPPVPESMRPRALPVVEPGSSRPVELAYNLIGVTKDGAKFRENGGFDEGGAAYSGSALGGTVSANGVTFNLGPVGAPDLLVAHGRAIPLRGRHRSLWLLGAAIEGSQHDQPVVVTYEDGTTQTFEQNFSDWYTPEDFPGEVRAVKMPYRNMADGSRDERPFYAYAYGFPLDGTKEVRSVTLPNEPNLRVLAVSVAD